MKRKRYNLKVYLLIFLAILILVPFFPIAKILVLNYVPKIITKGINGLGMISLIINNPNEYKKVVMEKIEIEDKEYRLNDNSSENSNEEISSNIEQAELEQSITSQQSSENKPELSSEISSQSSTQEIIKKKKTLPYIENKYRGTIVTEHYCGNSSNPAFVNVGTGYLRNYTGISKDDIGKILKKKTGIKFEQTNKPQILILHTHATESFEEYDCDYYDIRGTWRTTDNNKNMVAVGEILTKELETYGITVIHDYTQHDYPSYNGSYSRSAETVKKYLEKYPSIKVVFDLHRDGVERENNVIVKSCVEIEGEKAAQVMVVVGCDEDGSLNYPNWRDNLRFACEITNKLETDYKGITRPIFLSNAKYNMNLSKGLLILEFGTNANTLEEAQITAKYVGKSLGELFENKLEW